MVKPECSFPWQINPLTPGFFAKNVPFEATKAIVWLPSRQTEM